MANSNPPKKGQAAVYYIFLDDMAVAGSFKSSPTISAGDFKISKDGGAFANLTNLPTVTPSGGVAVQLNLTATEMTADQVVITGIDATSPKEWADFGECIPTTA